MRTRKSMIDKSLTPDADRDAVRQLAARQLDQYLVELYGGGQAGGG